MPDNVGPDAAAMMEPLAICVESVVNHSDFKAGDSVAISGSGVIGLLSLLLVKALGASTVIMGGTSRSADLKLSMAERLGADLIVQTDREDFAQAVMEHTGGRGVDMYIEASGAEQMIEASISFVSIWASPRASLNPSNASSRIEPGYPRTKALCPTPIIPTFPMISSA